MKMAVFPSPTFSYELIYPLLTLAQISNGFFEKKILKSVKSLFLISAEPKEV